MFIFNLNVVSQRIFLKMGLIRVRFTPGFPGEEFVPAKNGTRRGKWLHTKLRRTV
jgi:hypothetical protein